MNENDWVYPFIHKLFNSDIGKEGEKLRDSKLDYINLPLYKYCYVADKDSRDDFTIDYNIDNFEKDILFFQNPSKFNDPFDCFLGFSQSQMVREVLVQHLKSKKQYTPENRKIIAQLLNDNNTVDFEIVNLETIKPMIDTFLTLVYQDDPLREVYLDITQKLINQGEETLRRVMTNTMTIRDKERFVDEVFKSPKFVEAVRGCGKPDDFEFIMRCVPHDMKVKIEKLPDSFLSDNDGQMYGIFNVLKNIVNLTSFNDMSAEDIDNMKMNLNRASEEALNRSRNIISQQFRVTCLSERMDSPLMWSHYANKHYGFCLEYDFTPTVTVMHYPNLLEAQLLLFPVHYTEKRPLLTKSLFQGKALLDYVKNKKLPKNFLEKLMYGLLAKSQDWEYEREWRIFQLAEDNVQPIMHLPKARKVFLGANMEESTKSRVIEIAKKKRIPVFQMFLHSDKYKFDFYQIK